MIRAITSNRLLFRSYLFIAGSLVLVAIVLDYSFRQLQTDTVTPQLAATTIQLIEERLSGMPESLRASGLQELQDSVPFPLRLLPEDHVIGAEKSLDEVVEMSDSQGQVSFIRYSSLLHTSIQIGPFTEPDHALLDWLPRLFYLAVFSIIGVWLWPLVKDLNLVSRAASEFAADYRKPIQIEEDVTTLNELASNLGDMSAQIHSLIRNQKELAGALSHEMRTPLARIKFAMAVMQEKQGAVPEYTSISEDVKEIDGLIATMLDYARLDHPGTELNLELTPVDAWLEACTDRVDEMVANFEINNKLQSMSVRMDPQLMGLALSNLLMNASRYARSTIQLTVEQENSMTQLVVEDDGPGIPAEDRTNIFRPFTRLDGSRSKRTGGHGLGLAIVTRIADLHQGSVNATESDSGGAKITVSWPGSTDS